MSGDPLVCFVTHPAAGADDFARRLVEGRVAACVNRCPVTSTYRWQGEIEEDPEVLLVIKTARQRLGELERILEAHHPYDVPELVALAPASVGAAYGRWWLDALSPGHGVDRER